MGMEHQQASNSVLSRPIIQTPAHTAPRDREIEAQKRLFYVTTRASWSVVLKYASVFQSHNSRPNNCHDGQTTPF